MQNANTLVLPRKAPRHPGDMLVTHGLIVEGETMIISGEIVPGEGLHLDFAENKEGEWPTKFGGILTAEGALALMWACQDYLDSLDPRQARLTASAEAQTVAS